MRVEVALVSTSKKHRRRAALRGTKPQNSSRSPGPAHLPPVAQTDVLPLVSSAASSATDIVLRFLGDDVSSRDNHLSLIYTSPGYAEFLLDFMDKHARLLTRDVKPVLIQGSASVSAHVVATA
jgi:hypothetical protein